MGAQMVTERPDQNPVGSAGRLAAAAILVVLVSSCGSAAPEDCPSLSRLDLSVIDGGDATSPILYPLDVVEDRPDDADFCAHYGEPGGGMFHAAEDFWRPAGTEVYAMADGEVSFSGIMGRYGWLVIVDHPEMNIYSLYGHLSPSRWYADTGPVARGELIGYLGDDWENGGSRDKPLVTHLHLGVRAGQRTDYPARGEWRWMAGWIKSCPAELGWLQPSAVIAGQSIPDGGFAGPAGGLIERWWTEILIIGAFLLGVAWWTTVGIRRRNALLLGLVAVVAGGLARYLTMRGFIFTPAIYLAAAIGILAAVVILVRRPPKSAGAGPTPDFGGPAD